MFFARYVTKKTRPASEDHIRQACQLRDALKKKLKLTSTPNLDKWADEFRKLEEHQDPVKVEMVLAWYKHRIGGKFVPAAFSAKGFRNKFASLEAAMKRDEERTERVKVTNAARRIAADLLDLGWPKGSDAKLPGAVQVSLQRAVMLFDGLTIHVEQFDGVDDRDKPRTAVLAEWILSEHSAPGVLVRGWFRDVHARTSNWESWSGSLEPFLFDVDHKDFVAAARSMARERCGGSKVWDNLRNVIREQA